MFVVLKIFKLELPIIIVPLVASHGQFIIQELNVRLEIGGTNDINH
jgi:hypothetical protein